MADRKQLKILRKGVEVWNKWRLENPDISPGLFGANLRAANLSEADLCGANLGEADLREADLSGAILFDANLSAADLRGADLTEAMLWRADLRRADLRQANLSGAVLSRANLREADLRQAILTEVELADTSGYAASLENAVLAGARFTGWGEGAADKGFLALAAAKALETADFGDPDFLPTYLAEAFEYAHHAEVPEGTNRAELVAKAIRRIRLLRAIYPEADPPPALVKAIKAISAKLTKHLAKHPRELSKIKPRQFEELIAEILASHGWDVNLTQATLDGGYDIFAISRDDKADVQTSWIIECKKRPREKKVGVDIVRGLYGIAKVPAGASALLATTSDFSNGAGDYKASRYDLELKDFEGVLEWINTYRPNPDGKLHIKNNRLIVPGQD